ncbi:MAG: diguanylate cyclase [Bacillaceae bacterium]|nr:diguanylate cyclase [Bacillaceae bacterium]
MKKIPFELKILEDRNGEWRISDIVQKPRSDWQSYQQGHQLGYTNAVYWIHVIPPTHMKPDPLWYLEIHNASLDHIQLFVQRDDMTFESRTTGDLYPFSQREINYKNFVFPLSSSQMITEDFYLRIEASGAMDFPLTLWTPDGFIESKIMSLLGWGAFTGTMGIMIVYHLLFFVASRNTAYFYYAALMTGILLFQLTDSGLAFQYLWPQFPGWNVSAPGFFAGFILLVLVLFSQTFLQTKKHHPRMHNVLNSLNIMVVVITTTLFFGNHSVLFRSLMYLSFITFIILIILAVSRMRQGYSPARYYLLSFSALIAGGTASMARNLGFLPSNILTNNGMKIGSLLFLIVLSFGIMNLINALKKENLRIHQHRQLLETLYQMTNSITSTYDLNELAERILPIMRQILPTKNAFLFLKSGSTYKLKASAGEYGPRRITSIFHIIKNHDNLHNHEQDKLFPLETSGNRSDRPSHWALSIPIVYESDILGFIILCDKDRDRFEDYKMEVIRSFSQTAAIAIKNSQLFEEVQLKAVTDDLTGLYNRRHFFELADIEMSRSLRYSNELSIMMLDIDFFKRINDKYGHIIGDEILKKTAIRLKQRLRSTDIIGRFGGEEFVILLPETNLHDAVRVGEQLRTFIQDHPFDVGIENDISITISAGVAAVTKETTTIDDLVETADRALYKAKESGRNTIVSRLIYGSDDPG